MIKQITLVLLILLSISFAEEDACEKETDIITTSFHVFDAMFKNALKLNQELLGKYVGKTVYMSHVVYDTIILREDYSSILSWEDHYNRRFLIMLIFNSTPEIVRIFQEAVDNGNKPIFKIKGECKIADRTDPLTILFINCCLVDEKQDMIESFKDAYLPIESILNIPAGPWK